MKMHIAKWVANNLSVRWLTEGKQRKYLKKGGLVISTIDKR